MHIELEIKSDPNNKNAHYLSVYVDGKTVSYTMITLDEVEDLEGNLTNEILYLSKYRRKRQGKN